MNRLWVRLALAFVLVTISGVGIFGLLANWSASQAFSTYIARQEAFLSSGDLDVLAAYYTTHQSWEGVGAAVPGPGGPGRGAGRNRPTLLIADASGTVVFDEANARVGTPLSTDERARTISVIVDGAIVGYVVFEIPAGTTTTFTPTQQAFLNQLQLALAIAGLIALVIGIGLGVIISRSLAAPLARTAAAAHAFADRDWAQRAPVSGADEIADVARAFNTMADSLQTAETARRNLMADIAHELRTPLTVMQGNLRALLDGVYPLEAAEIANLYDETRLLSRLVDDLRELALADAGRLSLQSREVDLGGLLGQAGAQFAAAADAQGVRLDVRAAPARVRGDPDRIAQALRNLIANALRHTPAEGTISVHTEPLMGSVRVTVADTGEGIPPEVLGHVFERFYRADKSRARASGGTGLGLAITKAWVEVMGGRVGVESEVGRGSHFWFELPAV
ncbi:MAG: HAMP domain-containing protein [Anaerolineales bacterium]|nr:HAMP domain-containing protein [Anaerolineales bacterium]